LRVSDSRPTDSRMLLTTPRELNMVRINMPTTAADRIVGR
jgi:hypothetical protein